MKHSIMNAAQETQAEEIRLAPTVSDIGRVSPRRWCQAGEEPHLDDMLNDPIVHLVMRRDRIVRKDVELAVERGRNCLRARASGAGGLRHQGRFDIASI